MIKYSVIVPAYNIEKDVLKLKAFINKVNENRKDIEFIIVNDGSEDNTHNLLKDFSNIHYYKQDNQGVSVARNQGLKVAGGEFILFLDADDEFYEEIFTALDDAIYNFDGLDAYFYNYKVNEKAMNNDFIQGLYDKSIIMSSFFQRKFRFHICSVCIRNSFLKSNRILFKEGVAWGEDTDFVLNSLLKTDCKVFFLNKILFNYNFQSEGTMHSVITYNKAQFLSVLEELYDEIRLISDLNQYYKYYWQRGYIYMIKRALTNNVDSIETLNFIKNNIAILNDRLPVKVPTSFILARFIINKFSAVVFFVIKNKSRI